MLTYNPTDKEPYMNKIKFLIYLFIILFTFTMCLTVPPKSNVPEPMIYIYRNQTTEYTEYESISLSKEPLLVIYSVDRNNALIMMEMGIYSITDGVITIDAGKYQATGIITDEKIVIDDKEFDRK